MAAQPRGEIKRLYALLPARPCDYFGLRTTIASHTRSLSSVAKERRRCPTAASINCQTVKSAETGAFHRGAWLWCGEARVRHHDISHEETIDPLVAEPRNFYKVEKWTRDGTKVDSLLYAGNSLVLAGPVQCSSVRSSTDRGSR
jgi:hypothetical protein